MWISFFLIFTSILSIILCLPIGGNLAIEYEYLWIMPLSFLATYSFIYKAILKREYMQITTYVIIAFSWLRCVMTPMIGVISDFYTSTNRGVMATFETAQMASVMIAYEQIIVAGLFFLFSIRRPKKTTIFKEKISLEGNNVVYLVYSFIALAVFIVFGRNLDLFQFIFISVDEKIRRGDITDTSIIFIRQIISSGMTFFFLLIVEKCRKSYDSTKKSIYINYALIAAVLLVCIIMGERRSSQIYLAFASTWVLIRIFPLKRKKIISTVSFAALFVILMMSIYKFFHAFLYGSYFVALTETNFSTSSLAEMLDAYFYGVKVVSSNIGFVEMSQVSIWNILYDFVRSIFGLNFLLKDINMVTTSELYNLTIYSNSQSTGHLFSSIGYGTVYLGYIFAPLITWLNIYIAIKLEELLRKSKSIEMNYILSYIFMRYAFGLFSNPAPLISSASSFLIINGLIFIGAVLLVNQKRTLSSRNKIKGRERLTCLRE